MSGDNDRPMLTKIGESSPPPSYGRFTVRESNKKDCLIILGCFQEYFPIQNQLAIIFSRQLIVQQQQQKREHIHEKIYIKSISEYMYTIL